MHNVKGQENNNKLKKKKSSRMGQCKQHFIYVHSTQLPEIHFVYALPTPEPVHQNTYFWH